MDSSERYFILKESEYFIDTSLFGHIVGVGSGQAFWNFFANSLKELTPESRHIAVLVAEIHRLGSEYVAAVGIEEALIYEFGAIHLAIFVAIRQSYFSPMCDLANEITISASKGTFSRFTTMPGLPLTLGAFSINVFHSVRETS